MADGPILPNNALRPFDAAKDCLTPRLREHGGLSAASLPTSKCFRSAVEVVTEQRFATPLSQAVSPEVMRKVEGATEWLRTQIQAVSGRSLSFIEPFVIPELNFLGSQQYPLVKIREALATQIAKTPTAKEMRASSLQFNPEATQEAHELNLLSTVIHEYVHAARGVQVGRSSLDVVRLGLRVNAFNGQSTSNRFPALTEAAAILTESRFLTEQGLTASRRWFGTWFEKNADGSPEMLAWKEMQALNAKTIVASKDQPKITMRERFIALLNEVGIQTPENATSGRSIALDFTKYGNTEACTSASYKHLHWGMENLAAEMFRGRSRGALDSVKMFQEMLLKAEVLAEPRPVFREIFNLTKKDVAQADHSAQLDERLLGKRYLHFFAHLRPKDAFDLMIFQAFVKADLGLPKDRVASYRAELLDIYKHATERLNLTPNMNAG
jgi:hypothetical protein